jgi:WD40 repeat protein
MDYGECHDDLICKIVLVNDDSELWSISIDGDLKIWNAHKYMLLKKFKASHAGHVCQMMIASNGKFLYTASEDGQVKEWNVEKRVLERECGVAAEEKTEEKAEGAPRVEIKAILIKN